MPSSRIVACDQDITRVNSTAPESEEIWLRKVEAAARGFDLGPGDVSVLENCRLIMRRRADAPPLELPPAPLQRTMREQILDQQANDRHYAGFVARLGRAVYL